MKALVFHKSVPRYALLKLLGPRFRRLYSSAASPLVYGDTPDPKLPTEQWVRIRPRLSGICGSDLATLCAKGSTYLAPVTSMPFVMGHEIVGEVVEVGRGAKDIQVGQRVVVRPALGCTVRGINPPCAACRAGRDALCRNVTRGDIAAGIQTGYCRDTGGGFGQSLAAHRSQVFRVPDEMADSAAVLIEPFACALHAVLRAMPDNGQRVLVIGCGAVGLLTIAALRSMGRPCFLAAVAKYEHQREHARALGANEVTDRSGSRAERYRAWARLLDAELLAAPLGKPTVLGGADVTFDCIGSSQSIDDGLRFTNAGGRFVLVGMPGIPAGVDWTPLWYKELNIVAAYAYGREDAGRTPKDTFDIAIQLMGTWGPRLAKLVGPPRELSDYRAALMSAIDTGRSGVAKTVFAVEKPVHG